VTKGSGDLTRRFTSADISRSHPAKAGIIEAMLTRYIREAMKRARYKTLENGTCLGQIPGLAGVWANESTLDSCREVLQEVFEEGLVPNIRDHDPMLRIGRVSLPSRAA